MNSLSKLSFWCACLGFLLISANAFAIVVTAKPSASAVKATHPMASETWYGSSSVIGPSKITTGAPKITTMTWYTSHINYHNPELILSSVNNIATDSSGNLYFCWVDDGNLNYSTNASGAWVVNYVIEASGCESITVGSNGSLYIIYTDEENPTQFKLAVPGSTSTTLTYLGEIENAIYTSFAIDSTGSVHMSYFDSDAWIFNYATNSSGSWVMESVDGYRTGYGSQITLDNSNNPHISYHDAETNTLKHATKASGIWTKESIDNMESPSNGSSIAVDSTGYVHIAYAGINASGNSVSKYATNKSGSWKKRSLEINLVPWTYAEYDAFNHFSIALDSQKNAYISYSYAPVSGGGRSNAIKYATDKDGSWQSFTVADCNTVCGYFTKVIVTSSGLSTKITAMPILSSLNQKVAIAYQDYSSSLYNINYASTKEIEDTCSDFTLTLTDVDCDDIDDSEDTDQTDTDGDGTVDSADPDYLDSDNDGTVDSQDAFPNDPAENQDSDGDGIGDNAEIDSDNDGTPNVSDAFPEDATETTDTDEDGTGNNVDTDDDGDGFLDDVDPNPMTFDADNDHDGIPDSTDDDDDGDGIPDSTDADSGEG